MPGRSRTVPRLELNARSPPPGLGLQGKEGVPAKHRGWAFRSTQPEAAQGKGSGPGGVLGQQTLREDAAGQWTLKIPACSLKTLPRLAPMRDPTLNQHPTPSKHQGAQTRLPSPSEETQVSKESQDREL